MRRISFHPRRGGDLKLLDAAMRGGDHDSVPDRSPPPRKEVGLATKPHRSEDDKYVGYFLIIYFTYHDFYYASIPLSYLDKSTTSFPL